MGIDANSVSSLVLCGCAEVKHVELDAFLYPHSALNIQQVQAQAPQARHVSGDVLPRSLAYTDTLKSMSAVKCSTSHALTLSMTMRSHTDPLPASIPTGGTASLWNTSCDCKSMEGAFSVRPLCSANLVV